MGSSEMDTIPETGAVFTIGRSRFADNIASHFFIRKDPVVSVSCGDEHSAVICQSGRLFVFGSNNWGQLGLGHKNHVSKPSCVKILKPEKVTHVACGRAHTLICTGTQKIFACGSDQEGQLGRGSGAIGDSASSPVLVYDCGLAGPRIVQIAAGSHHSLALTSDGGVVAWGSNLEGQLGQPGTSGLVKQPTKVHVPEPVKEISAGYYHSAFLTESGLVYVCGESESGKLGIHVNFSTQAAPKQMQLPCGAAHLACGGHHTVVLGENGNLYCAGSNVSGQLGMGAKVTEAQTAKLLSASALKNETISRIACGESHTAVLTESGKLFTCGDGRHGKLGLEENENNVHELTFAPKYQELFVSNVACGGCHTILVARRRDSMNQGNHEGESVQDPLGKKNPLPPLKLPVNRLQSESTESKSDEMEKSEATVQKEPASETVEASTEESNVQTTAKSPESQDKNSINNTSEEITEDSSTKDSNETNKSNTSESSENIAKETTNETSSEPTGQDNESNEQKEGKEIEESKESTDVKSAKADNTIGVDKKETPVTDTQSNVQNETKTDTSLDNESSQKEESKEDEAKPEKNTEAEKDTTAEIKVSPEKRISSGNTPPPKPPRLKPGSAGSSPLEKKPLPEEEKKSSPEHSESLKAHLPDSTIADSNMTTVTEINMTNDRIEIVSIGNTQAASEPESNEGEKIDLSTKVESIVKKVETESSELKAKGDDMVANVKESMTNVGNAVKEGIEQIESKTETEATEDDADVIQSPVSKPGKMKSLFKPKRQEEIAKNGTKVTATNKSKSKTCSIL